MQEKELQELTERAKPLKIAYDEYELTLTFDNGTEIYIRPGTEYECGIFEISSNIEREASRLAYEEQKRKEDEKDQKVQQHKKAVLDSLIPEHRINVMSLLNK